MTSLRQLLSTHASLLLIDAASTRVQVGLFDASGPTRWQTSGEEASEGVFASIEALRLDLSQIHAFAFCEGPGSVLGVRTTAMAVRTWRALAGRPVFAYCSLALVAHALKQPDVTVIADARRNLWHRFNLEGGLSRSPATGLTGRLVMPDGFRHWSPLPPHVSPTPYVLAELLARTSETNLFRETNAPDAFLHEEPSYATWTPQIHRAPTAKP